MQYGSKDPSEERQTNDLGYVIETGEWSLIILEHDEIKQIPKI